MPSHRLAQVTILVYRAVIREMCVVTTFIHRRLLCAAIAKKFLLLLYLRFRLCAPTWRMFLHLSSPPPHFFLLQKKNSRTDCHTMSGLSACYLR